MALYVNGVEVLATELDDIRRLLRTGEYIVPTGVNYVSSAAVAANSIYAISLFIVRDITVDRIAIETTIAAAAGKLGRLGIYRDGTNLYPGARVLDSGTFAVDDAAGIHTITISQALTKGLYWLVFASDGTPTIRMLYGNQAMLGASPLGLSATNLSLLQHGWTKGNVGIGALADPFVADGTLVTSGLPLITLRLLTLA